MADFFRQEVIEKKRGRYLGVVLEVTFLNKSAVVSATLFVVIALLLFLTFASYTKRNSVAGEVISTLRPITISSQHQGYISDVYVTVASTVTAGQKVYRINTGKNIGSGIIGERSIIAIKRQIETIKDIVLGLETNQAKTENNLVEQRDKYLALNASSVELLSKSIKGLHSYEATLNNYRSYQQKGLITKDQYIYQLNNYFQQQNIWNGINNQHVQERVQIINIEAEIASKKIEFQNQVLEYQLKLQDLDRQLAAVEAETDVYVVAPYAGKIESLNIGIGQYVTFNDDLAQMLPHAENEYQLILWVPDKNMPYLLEDAPVSIRYDAFAWQKFGQFSGQIREISRVPASLQEMSHYRSAPREELIRSGGNYFKVACSIKSDGIIYNGRMIPLSNGLTANVTLYLEQRPLWQWILSPLYDVKESVSGPVI
ncbi:HlyD family efflux transporter periplasmic adaptor subunit [Pantoea sp.]|uniref:HlyD family secretion protein n=1 Tax=Pantoea sp. TaxID=69393 RepID=UPI0031D56DE6